MTKKLLFITTKYPYPLVSGDRVRAFYLISMLAKRYSIDLLVFEDFPGLDPRSGSGMTIKEGHKDASLPVGRVIHIPQQGWKKKSERAWNLVRGLPAHTAYYTFGEVRRYVREQSARYDILFCHLARTGEYARGISIPKILDYSDAYSLLYAPHQRPKGFWGWFSFFEYPRMRAYEKNIAEEFDRCIVASGRDARWLSRQCGVPEEKLSIVPNGVSEELLTRERTEPDTPTLVFSGNMSYYPNVDAITYFVREIFPAIQKRVPSVRLIIVGAYPHKLVLRLQNDAIEVTGCVDDIGAYLCRATVIIAPLRTASGVQNKVLEAMALGLPVVTMPVVVEGIEGATDKYLAVAQSDEDIANAIVRLLGDKEERMKLGNSARGFIRRTYRWQDSERKLFDALDPGASPG